LASNVPVRLEPRAAELREGVRRGDDAEVADDRDAQVFDEDSGQLALAHGGPYLIYLAPAMYGPDDPAGGYVAVGGPAGVYGAKGEGTSTYEKLDTESPQLPAEIVADPTSLPRAVRSEAQLLHEGPK
jgi:hypothetical protein